MAKKIAPEEYYWSDFQLDVMRMVERYPVTYIRDYMMTPTQYRAAMTTAWDKIARDLRKPQKECALAWFGIKYRYAKVNNLMIDRRVPEEILKMHPKTSKYLLGCLDFMDGYVDEIDDDEIPLVIHKRFNKLFGLTNKQKVTMEMVEELIKKRDLLEQQDEEMAKLHMRNVLDSAAARTRRNMLPPPVFDDAEVPDDPDDTDDEDDD